MQLDELLDQLHVHLQEVLAARDGVHSLLDAVVSIGRDLELETVLERIAAAAVSLVDCRYGALGVVGDDGELAQFIPVGVSDDQISGIAEWPHGRGILGLLIKEPRTLRLDDLARAPESYGFPAGHPPMKSFLGVPILIRDTVFGNLYLTEKVNGAPFTEQDEVIVSALATAAGIVIENARLYDDMRRRELWLDASGEITRELLSGIDSAAAMQLIVRRARQMANGDSAAIAVPRAGAGRLGVVASDGDVDTVGLELSIDDTVAGAVLRSGESMSVNVLHQDEESSPLLARFAGGPAVLIPLGVGDRVRGVVAVGRRPGGLPFTDAVVRMLRAFADQAAVILELADTRREAERFELADDRGRIARDLHDLVIQRLFGSAMTLTGVVRLIDNPDVAGRVERTVDDLDVTIKQIRSTIFALQSRMTGSGATLRSQIVDAVERAAERLGFAPALRLEGLLDTAVPEDLVEHVVAVVQETLSNAVRHARASRVEVWVALVDHHLVVQVSDDGVGVGRVTHRSGLANLTSRAEQLRGSCAIRSPATGGTLVEWRVPI